MTVLRLLCFTCLAIVGFALESGADRDLGVDASGVRRKKVRWIYGHVTHGMNVFNGRQVYDFNDVSVSLAGLHHETMGVFNPDPSAENASAIRDDTDQMARVASLYTPAFHRTDGPHHPPAMGPYNVPVYEVPTLNSFSHSEYDRHRPASFKESWDLHNLTSYAAFRKNEEVTLEQYNSAFGLLRIACFRDGTARFKLQFEALPLALYTVWDMIVVDPLASGELTVPVAFGGLPNVITTDRHGYGKMSRKLAYCPLNKCEDVHLCSAAVLLNYHMDNMVYGGAMDLSMTGYGQGGLSSVHMMFAIHGKPFPEFENHD